MRKNLVLALMITLALFTGQIVAQEAQESPTKKAAAKEQTPETTEEAMKVSDFACGTAVEERELQGEAKTFSAETEKVFCWTLIEGCEEPTTVEHVWYYAGEEKARVPLYIKYPRMRTWSSKTMMPEWKGDWKVDMVDEAGKVLATVAFKMD